jgi:hypothetical protein
MRQAAQDHQVALTPHETAIERAGEAAARLNGHLASLRGTGRLKIFDQHYKAARSAARARGESGFMSYSVALGRLRQALIPILVAR